MKKLLVTVGILVGALLLGVISLIVYWYLRPNRAQVNYDIVLETWDIDAGQAHNSNTDMIRWGDWIYIAYVSSPYHFANDASVLHIKRSIDLGHTWEQVETFNPPGEDIRDPKLAVISGQLFLYALKNTDFVAEPYITVYASTSDGTEWTDFRTIPELDGWLFWRPKTRDGLTFYNAAYWYQHGRAALLRSTDGFHWEIVSIINEGERNDETEIEFLPDGRMLATARLEYDESWLDGALGDPRGATLITISDPPYTSWTELAQSKTTRLDGPYLFSYHDRVYAVGRYQPDLGRSGPFTGQGSALSRKRTSLFEVRLDGLAYLTDLPSAGDTSYEGVVLDGDTAYISYYTSPIDRDYAWILGMFSPSAVRMAKVDMAAMEALANQNPAY